MMHALESCWLIQVFTRIKRKLGKITRPVSVKLVHNSIQHMRMSACFATQHKHGKTKGYSQSARVVKQLELTHMIFNVVVVSMTTSIPRMVSLMRTVFLTQNVPPVGAID